MHLDIFVVLKEATFRIATRAFFFEIAEHAGVPFFKGLRSIIYGFHFDKAPLFSHFSGNFHVAAFLSVARYLY
jgi:hypothetical protein